MDFHCHVDLYPDAQLVYAESAKKMEFVWLVTTSPRAFEATSKVLPTTEWIVVSPGLHPEVAEKKSGELNLFLRQLEFVKVVGEVGLDGSLKYRPHFEIQKSIFSEVIKRCQSLGGRVISIHSRAAAKEVLDTLERFPGFGTAVLHWFTDSAPQLMRANTLGCWFSVGPAMLASKNGRQLSALMPRDRVVAESDGPFARVGGVSVMPWQAMDVAVALAEIWRVTPLKAAETVRENGRRLIEKMERRITN